MRILITNDDGVMAPGIEALYLAAAEFGEAHVVAPETPQSAMGHAITVLTPMATRRVHVNNVFHGWSVDGRPADCVKLAILELLDDRPDLVLSGINSGINTGVNVLYSGTVAGAAEGAFYGIPSMAFSLELSANLDFRGASTIARRMIRHFIESKPEPGACVSVNIPALDEGWPNGVRVCPQGTEAMHEHFEHRDGPRGRSIYWLDGRLPEIDVHPESDLAAIRERYVAVTPLQFDLTDRARFDLVAKQDWNASYRRED